MAFRKTLAQRLFGITRISSSHPTLTHAPISSPLFQKTTIPPDPARSSNQRDFLAPPDPGDNGFFRRFLQKRKIVQSAVPPEMLRSLPVGDKLLEKLKAMNIYSDRIHLDGLSPLERMSEPNPMEGISVEDARKLLRLYQLEVLKRKLREIPQSCIPYSDFVRICTEDFSNPDHGLEFAKMLDESGTVIVLGNLVFLRPEQVAKVIQGLLPVSVAHPTDPRRKELQEMEKQKMGIDKKAESLVRREMWAGLGFLIVQTAAFVRLTFWELSWDVMEPICFYVTSGYFMAGYAFFLGTSRDPSFEGFFESRFSVKQKQLMKIKNFDIERFNELRKACYSHSSPQATSPFDKRDSEREELVDALTH